jgi:hypothetical protein
MTCTYLDCRGWLAREAAAMALWILSQATPSQSCGEFSYSY